MAAMLFAQRQLGRIPGNPTRYWGFTLTELQMVTGIVSLVMTLALPSRAAMLSSQGLSTYASSLLLTWQLVRNDAGKRGGNTVVAPIVTRLEVVAAPTQALAFNPSTGVNFSISSRQGWLIDTAGDAVVGRGIGSPATAATGSA